MVPTCQGQWPIFPPPTATDRLPSTHRLLLKILYFSVLIFLLPNDCFVSFFLTVLRFMTSKYWLLGGLMPTPLFVSNPTLGDLTQHAGFVCHCYANDSHSLAPSLTYSIDSRLIYPVSYSTPLSGWETYPIHVQNWTLIPSSKLFLPLSSSSQHYSSFSGPRLGIIFIYLFTLYSQIPLTLSSNYLQNATISPRLCS